MSDSSVNIQLTDILCKEVPENMYKHLQNYTFKIFIISKISKYFKMYQTLKSDNYYDA